MKTEARQGQVEKESVLERIPLWTIGPILYFIGAVLSLVTDNVQNFLLDYPWACFILAISIGTWAMPRFQLSHERATLAIRNAFSVTDEDFDEILRTNMERLNRLRNLVFGFIFIPILLWAWSQRLWWQEYTSPYIFDLYYLALIAFVIPTYAAIMFGAVVACHMNIHRLCERIPINSEYILEEGRPIIRRFWGGLIAEVTVVAFVMSALTNIPILLYSGEIGLILNLALALTLTIVIFILPHYLFHRMLERAKNETHKRVLELKKKLGSWQLEAVTSDKDEKDTLKMLNLVYLTQYEWNMKAGSTWLVDLKAVTELLVVATMHFVLLEVLTALTHI